MQNSTYEKGFPSVRDSLHKPAVQLDNHGEILSGMNNHFTVQRQNQTASNSLIANQRKIINRFDKKQIHQGISLTGGRSSRSTQKAADIKTMKFHDIKIEPKALNPRLKFPSSMKVSPNRQSNDKNNQVMQQNRMRDSIQGLGYDYKRYQANLSTHSNSNEISGLFDNRKFSKNDQSTQNQSLLIYEDPAYLINKQTKQLQNNYQADVSLQTHQNQTYTRLSKQLKVSQSINHSMTGKNSKHLKKFENELQKRNHEIETVKKLKLEELDNYQAVTQLNMESSVEEYNKLDQNQYFKSKNLQNQAVKVRANDKFAKNSKYGHRYNHQKSQSLNQNSNLMQQFLDGKMKSIEEIEAELTQDIKNCDVCIKVQNKKQMQQIDDRELRHQVQKMNQKQNLSMDKQKLEASFFSNPITQRTKDNTNAEVTSNCNRNMYSPNDVFSQLNSSNLDKILEVKNHNIDQSSFHFDLRKFGSTIHRQTQSQLYKTDSTVKIENDLTSSEDENINEQSSKQISSINFAKGLQNSIKKKLEQNQAFKEILAQNFNQEADHEKFSKMLLLGFEQKKKQNNLVNQIKSKIKQKLVDLSGKNIQLIQPEKLSKQITQKESKFFDHLQELRKREQILTHNLKQIHKPKQNQGQNDQINEYLKNCVKQNALPMPKVVTQLKDQAYRLFNYNLNDGLAKAIASCINMNTTEKLKTINLSNNLLKDEYFAQILSSLDPQTQLSQLKNIIYTNQNEFGHKSAEVISNLVLRKQPPDQLDALRIVNCKIQGGAVHKILESMSKINYIKHLQLPKCHLSEKSADLLSHILLNCTPKLVELDISFNQLPSHSMGKIIKCFEQNTTIQDLNLSWNEIKPDLDLKPLTRFIRMNTNLIHLDFSSQLNSVHQIMQIIKAVKKSLSLQSLHLNNTQLVSQNQRLKSYIKKKLNIREQHYKNNQKPNVHAIFKDQWKEQMMMVNEKNQAEIEMENYKQLRVVNQESIPQKERYILSRVLGHPEINGSSQWTQSQECYICDRWTYTIFLHEKQSENQQESFSTSAYSRQKCFLHGSFDTFCNQMQYKTMSLFKFVSKFDNEFDGYSQPSMTKKQKANELKNLYQSQWFQLLKQNLRFKDPQMIPDMELRNLAQDSYIYADFVKPNMRTEWFSFSSTQVLENSQQPQLFFPKVRKEEIKPFVYLPKKNKEFIDRFPNMFSDWKMDNLEAYQKMAGEDFKYWKINRFIKDQEDIKYCENLVLKYYKELKDIFVSLISMSYYPNCNWLEFVNFIRECEILDNNVNLASIDRHFIATNVELEEIDENPDRALCRYEFLEILVRIAGQKFRETKITTTFGKAFEKIILDYILPKCQVLPWQSFREEQLWQNREINLTLEANLEGIQKIYKKYLKPLNSQISYQSALDVMMKDSEVQLGVREATKCFGMSKMSVIYEMAKGPNPYKKLAFVEFLEYICRAAYEKYKDYEDWPLYQKLECILDDLLLIVNYSRKEMNKQIQMESQESEESVNEEDIDLIQEQLRLVNQDRDNFMYSALDYK